MKNEMALDLRTGALVKLKSPESLIKEYKTNTTDTKENTEMTRKKKIHPHIMTYLKYQE